jgi:hypothetical protein
MIVIREEVIFNFICWMIRDVDKKNVLNKNALQ